MTHPGPNRAGPSLEQVLAPARALARANQAPSSQEQQASAHWAQHARAADPPAVYRALTPILLGRYVPKALQWLLDAGVLDELLPALAATSRMRHGSARFKDVWEHTKAVVWQSVPLPALRWAALLHDVGKVRTFGLRDDGSVHFLGHEAASHQIFCSEVTCKVAFDPKEEALIAALILHHQRPSQYESAWSDAAVRRFAREYEGIVDELLLLSRADITSKIPGRRKARLLAMSQLARRIRQLKLQDQRMPALPKGLGHRLQQALQIGAGPQLGAMIRRLQKLVEEGRLPARAQPEVYTAYARAQGWADDPPACSYDDS